MARSVSRGVVKARAQQLADVVNDPNVTDAELNGLFDVHLAAFYDILGSVGAQADYFYTKTQFSTVGGQSDYPLTSIAPDLLSLTNVFAIESLSSFKRPIFPFNDKQLGMYRAPTSVTTVALEYIPACPVLTDDSQTFDAVDGWDVLVSALMARDILQKRQQDAGLVMAIAGAAEARIKTYGTKRMRGGPKYVEDVEAIGNIFPPTSRLAGFRLRGGNLEIYELIALGWP